MSIVDLCKRSIVTPFGEVVVHGTLGKKIVWKHVSQAAATALVENRIEYFMHINAPRTNTVATLARLRNHLADDLPLLIGKLVREAFTGHISHRALHCFEELKVWQLSAFQQTPVSG